MKKLTLALATTAIAAAASSTLVSTAEAGGRGGHHFHFRLHQFANQQSAYRDEEAYYIRRKRKVVVKQVVKYVEKPAAKPAAVVAKYVDGQGRQFDLTSKVWFDGKSQCWQGDKAFAFKNGAWSYGDARWIESSAGWGVSSGEVPQQVSCDGIKAFSAKIEQAQAKPAQKSASVVEPKVEKVEQAEVKPVEKPAKVATSSTETATKTSDCKKYFPSVGEMVSVPCGE
jgi:hypothetical protein